MIPHKLGPASDSDIEKFKYVPEPPTKFTALDIKSGSATLKWDTSGCAKQYLLVWEEEGEDINVSQNRKVLKGNESEYAISGLKPCINYDAIIIPIYGDEYGDETPIAFASVPYYDAASDLSVNVKKYKTSATISWNTSVAESGASIACIENYNVTVCEIKNNDKCIGPESIKMILSQVKHNITGLTGANSTFSCHT